MAITAWAPSLHEMMTTLQDDDHSDATWKGMREVRQSISVHVAVIYADNVACEVHHNMLPKMRCSSLRDNDVDPEPLCATTTMP